MEDEDEFDTMLKDLQNTIEEDERQTYSPVVLREYRNPTYFGVLQHPDSVGEIKGPCGDTMRITVNIRDGKIQDARFWTDGCGATLASGNMLLKMIKGKTLQQATAVTPQQLLDALEGLPSEHIHCTVLAVTTLKKALEQYQKKTTKD
ncbi:MAG: iron-sulfur cluster assembly scaffold protein [Candidatus Thermoplasmatota archaeon]|nr:iron-sulfur cluster assembly scaffold protein [Candidatus Thermoplasmatota archaeon]